MAAIIGRDPPLSITKRVAANALAVLVSSDIGQLGTMLAFVQADIQQPIFRFLDLSQAAAGSNTVNFVGGIAQGELVMRGALPLFRGGGGVSACRVGEILIRAAADPNCQQVNAADKPAYRFKPAVFAGLQLEIGSENIVLGRDGLAVPIRTGIFMFYGAQTV